MKSYLCFTPSAPGKPGQLLEVVGDESRQQYAEPVSYAALLNENDVTSQELGKLRGAVTETQTALRHAKSKGAGAAEIQRLQKAFEAAKAAVVRVHYDHQQERQQQRTGSDTPTSRLEPASPFSRQSGEEPAPVVKKKAGTWDKFLADLDDRLAKRALAALRPTVPAAHAQNICCQGQYLCPRCKAKKAAA